MAGRAVGSRLWPVTEGRTAGGAPPRGLWPPEQLLKVARAIRFRFWLIITPISNSMFR